MRTGCPRSGIFTEIVMIKRSQQQQEYVSPPKRRHSRIAGKAPATRRMEIQHELDQSDRLFDARHQKVHGS
jgi:hypothetical protein